MPHDAYKKQKNKIKDFLWGVMKYYPVLLPLFQDTVCNQ